VLLIHHHVGSGERLEDACDPDDLNSSGAQSAVSVEWRKRASVCASWRKLERRHSNVFRWLADFGRTCIVLSRGSSGFVRVAMRATFLARGLSSSVRFGNPQCIKHHVPAEGLANFSTGYRTRREIVANRP
jgi:hypothetical protein